MTRWRDTLAGAALCATVGLLLLWSGGWPVQLSYDLLFLFRQTESPEDVVVVYMDDKSFTELGQRTLENWDRNLHAKLLDRLTDDEARLVVFDIVFSEPTEPDADANLARAIARNGNTVLAAALDYQARPQIKVKSSIAPLPMFADAAAGWGLAALDQGAGDVVRQYYDGQAHGPSLPIVAARLIASPSRPVTNQPPPEWWLNYYGPPLTVDNISYSEAITRPAGSFKDKVVFVGARPKTLKAHDEVDEFRTPHSLWTRELMPGVEIGATAFLNLIRNDELVRWQGHGEWVLVLVTGALLGALLGTARLWVACGIAIATIAILLVVAIKVAQHHVWFPWTVTAFAQVPVALAWSMRGHFHRLRFEKEVLERTLQETSRFAEAAGAAARDAGIVIPDHTLLRCVGKGAYGEVWLARNAIGVFHAVKIVKRQSFPADAPYEREFRGIQKFMPVSRSHAGLVDVLHVGRNDDVGYFFCIMEAADDQTTGQDVDPDRYAPKTLAGELNWRGKLSPEQALQLGLGLSLALEHLHQQQLLHRDIKPGNIIYVNGAPKFADIGLVTEQRTDAQDVSAVGTEGYIPPEGPGTPSADVYALGKVLYEATMGRDRQLFPEVPTAVWEEPEDALLRRLNEVIGRACASDVRERYPSAEALHTALSELRDVE